MPTITKTIGAAGDYANPQLWADDLDNTGVYASGDIAAGDIIDDTEFDLQISITKGAISGIIKRILTVNPTARGSGLKGTGARIAKSGTGASNAAVISANSDVDTEISWLGVSAPGDWDRLIAFAVDNTARTHSVHHCILHDSNPPSGGTLGIFFADVNVECHNNQFINFSNIATGGAETIGIRILNSVLCSTKCFNNTGHNFISNNGSGGAAGITDASAIGGLHRDHANKQFRNNTFTEVGGTSSGLKKCFDLPSAPANAILSHNASSDTTAIGTGSLTNIVAGDEFISIVGGSEDFNLKTGSTLFEAGVDLGTTPANVNIDATGRDRDLEVDTWSIGAFQLETGAPPDVVAISNPAQKQPYQRDLITGLANIPMSGTYSGSPTAIEGRLNGGIWAVVDAAPAGGTWSGTLANQSGQGLLEARFANDITITDSVADISVCDIAVGAGQSNAEGRLDNLQVYTHATLMALLWKDGGIAWEELTDPSDTSGVAGSIWPLLATQLMENQGVPIAFITTADGSTGLCPPDADWTKGGVQYNKAIQTVANSGVNGVRWVIFDQGGRDIANSIPRATYNAALDQMATDFVADLPGPLSNGVEVSPKLIVREAPEFVNLPSDAAVDAIRLAEHDAWDDNPLIYAGAGAHDILTDDGLHYKSDASGLLIAKRDFVTIEEADFGGTNGRGPRKTSLEFNAARDEITVAFDKNLKTGLTFSLLPWAVTDSLGAVTISAIDYHPTDANKVIISLATAAVGATTVNFSSGNSGAGTVMPQTPDITPPVGSVFTMPAEIFIAESVVDIVTIPPKAHYYRQMRA